MPPRWIWGVLGAGGILSLALFLTIRDWEQHELEQRAAGAAQEQVERLRISVLRSMEVLHSIAALHAAAGRIEPGAFRQFVQGALERQRELAALSWNPVVSHAERSEFEVSASTAGSSFQFLEAGAAGRLQPASVRASYVPVYLIEPLANNAVVLGYDLNSDPRRQAALEQACDSARPVATAPIKLAQGPTDQPGMLVLLPIYQRATPVNPSERRRELAGYAVAVFRVGDLALDVFQNLEERGIHVSLWDTSPEGGLLYASATRARTGRAAGQSSTAQLEVAGRQWQVAFAPTRQFATGQSHAQSWLVLAGGLLITVLAAAYLHGGWRRTEEATLANAVLQQEVVVRQRAEADADTANRAKSDFLASMSHEIRTPLNAILGYTQLMQRDSSWAPEQRDAVAAINASGRHLLGLINEILDLSKIEAGRMELNPGDFDLSGLAGELTATFRPLCAEKRIRFRMKLTGGAGTRVHGDEGKLRQVLINLLGNALKFTRAGEVFLGIKSEAGGGWLFEVVDTGLGIAEEERAEIFKPFHQGRIVRHQGGTGLGLAIAQRQVALLGGNLALQSERGFGSRFFFTLPLPPGQNAAEEVPSRHILHLTPGQTVRVLVVDDNRDNREVLAGMLGEVGCEVSFATNAAETLAQVRTVNPHAVFLDLLLPDQTGTDVARRITGNPDGAQTKIIMHSAAALTRHREEALAAGCVDFVTKPVTLERLCECLERHLGVRFDVAESAPPVGLLPRLEHQRVVLPADLYSRLTVAAELHSTTALKAALQDLRQQDAPADQLADEIRHLMRSYDMDGIQRLLAKIAVPESTEPVNT